MTLPLARSAPQTRFAAPFVVLAICLATLVAATPSGAVHPLPHASCDKGPVGWDTYRRLDRLPEIRCGVTTHQFSSFNRDGGNQDGQGRYACLRHDPVLGCVLAEVDGAGEIGSIWFTRDRGNVSTNGTIRIDLDGQRVLDAPLTDVVNGEVGPPFSHPLVANADQSSGGVTIKVPMPFRERMVVSIDDARYYHVTYRRFADASGVATFDQTDPAHDVLAMWRNAGGGDPKAALPAATTTSAVKVVPPGTTVGGWGDGVDGSGLVTALRVRLPGVQGIHDVPRVWEARPDLSDHIGDYSEYPTFVPNPAVHALDQAVQDLRLHVTVDGSETVDVPLGEFFGATTGEYDVNALMFTMSRAADGWYEAWWPMPFADDLEVALENIGDLPIDAEIALTTTADPTVGPRLASGALGVFRTQSRRNVTTPGRDHLFLDARGTGHAVGVVHTTAGAPYDPTDPEGLGLAAIRQHLEGDMRVHIDGSKTPQVHGTGTEDFYEGGWYFNRSVFSNPLNGNPVHEMSAGDCLLGCTTMYRLLLSDALTFSDGIRWTMEVAWFNEEVRTYSSTAFWYGTSHANLSTTDVVDVGDEASETEHGYRGDIAPAVALDATFEGDDDDVVVTNEGRAAIGPVAFDVIVDPANRGVVLRRLSDQRVPYQSAEVYVDGHRAGRWSQPLGNEHHRWLHDTFEIPASLTTGRSALTIELVPNGHTAWHAAVYEVRSRV